MCCERSRTLISSRRTPALLCTPLGCGSFLCWETHNIFLAKTSNPGSVSNCFWWQIKKKKLNKRIKLVYRKFWPEAIFPLQLNKGWVQTLVHLKKKSPLITHIQMQKFRKLRGKDSHNFIVHPWEAERNQPWCEKDCATLFTTQKKTNKLSRRSSQKG